MLSAVLHATPIPSVRPSVRLSVCHCVTRVYCIKTAEDIIEIFSLLYVSQYILKLS